MERGVRAASADFREPSSPRVCQLSSQPRVITDFQDRIASIDFKLPYVLSGSSDKHLRLFDVLNASGWSTCPPEPAGTSLTAETPGIPSPDTPTSTSMRQVACPTCGASVALRGGQHDDLVRSVALGSEFVVSGSYDLTIKVRNDSSVVRDNALNPHQVWERATGTLVADLKGGHTGRIFCVAFDPTKVFMTSSFTGSGADLRLGADRVMWGRSGAYRPAPFGSSTY